MIKNFDSNNPILEFLKKGIRPENIKEALLISLKPYFRNQNLLNEIAMNELVGGWINFELFKKNTWYFDKFEKCLELFKDAYEKKNKECISAIVDWSPEISQCITKYWSFLHLEVDKDELGLYEYLEENLKNIGQILEGIIKTYLKLLLQINRIRLNIPIELSKIKQMDLGVLVDELIKKTNFPELFQPIPWKLRLNQWRNIAYHHSAAIEDDRIKCWYRKKNQNVNFYLSREELLLVTKTIINTYNIFKNVEFIFVFDNYEEIQKESSLKNLNFKIRDEAIFLELYSNISAQGFKITDMSINDTESKLIVQELLDEQDPEQRAIHSSQFLYSLWVYSQSEKVVIEYQLKNGSPFFESSTTEKVCEKIANGTEEFNYLASNFDFKKIKQNLFSA